VKRKYEYLKRGELLKNKELKKVKIESEANAKELSLIFF